MSAFRYFVAMFVFSVGCHSFEVPGFQSALAEAKESQSGKIKIGTKGDELLFDLSAISAEPNQTINLTFQNNASKTSGLQHNWVLVKVGTADKVGQAGITAGPEKGYIPQSRDVLAHTKLLNAGEHEAIEFKAPSDPGEYCFICTFPGHYVSMKGVMTVK